ncbi:Os04g0533300, partial [Oryza sativa Japonica Group]
IIPPRKSLSTAKPNRVRSRSRPGEGTLERSVRPPARRRRAPWLRRRPRRWRWRSPRRHPPLPLAIVEKVADEPPAEKPAQGGSNDRDVALARVETEKRNSLIKAWEENEKTKAENKASKKLSAILSWENTKKANIEAQLKKIEEQLEKKKAEYAEKMKNKVAIVHKEAEEKRAMVEAKRGEEVLKAEEMAAKYRATGHAPKKLIGCFGA